jgi:hypothetical protein
MGTNTAIAARRPQHKGFLVGALLLALTLIVAVIAARPGADNGISARPAPAAARATTTSEAAAAPSVAGLTARQDFFDFGTISMASGKVSHRFWFRNDAAAPLLVKRIYTSCMCTTATLVKAMRIVGSYGMAGHGPMPDVNESFAPGEAAYVDVVFDPAAHGPAGLGHTERVVSIETDARQRLQLAFVANVRP